MKSKLLFILIIISSAAVYAGVRINNGMSPKEFMKVPLYFTANQGQTDQSVKFISKGNNCTMYFMPHQTTFFVSDEGSRQVRSEKAVGFAFHLSFVNSNTSASISGEAKLEGASNYFLGNEPGKWVRDVTNYQRLVIKDLYDGIDVLYYGKADNLEYDFILEAGADPHQILLAFDPGDYERTISLNENGDLVIPTPFGDVTEHKPVCYQVIDDEKIMVDGRFRIMEGNLYTIDLGSYNNSYPLVIDPVIEFSTYFGGSGNDLIESACRDASGNIYISGITESNDYPVKAGAYSESKRGLSEAFITKFDPSGKTMLYSTYFGGNRKERIDDMTVDDQGNVYAVLTTNSYQFPTTENALSRSMSGPWDYQLEAEMVIMKMGPSGNELLYSSYFGGPQRESAGRICTDKEGSIYAAFFTESILLPVTEGTKKYSNKDIYLLKLSPEFKQLCSTYVGGNEEDRVGDMVADNLGNLFLTGISASSDFTITENTIGTSFKGGSDIFLTKFDTEDLTVSASCLIGGDGSDGGTAIKCDVEGNVYLAGYAGSDGFTVTEKNLSPSLNGPQDAVFMKISPNLDKLVYSTYLGGKKYDRAVSLEVVSPELVCIAGTTNSPDFPVCSNAFDKTYNGGYYDYNIPQENGGDVFVCQLDLKKSRMPYATYFGGTGNEDNPQLIVSDNGSLILIGYTNSDDLPLTKDANVKNSGTEMFMAVINPNEKLPKNNAPAYNIPLNDVTATYNQPFQIDIPAKTFTDSDPFEVLPCSFMLSDGKPLPAWMRYDRVRNRIIGLPTETGTWEVKIVATDNQNASTSGEFVVTVTDPGKEKKEVDLERGLVVCYPFDGSSEDASKNHCDGELVRARLCADRNGKPESACQFNGSDTYVKIENIKELNDIKAISICAWIKPVSYGPDSYIAWISKPAGDSYSQFRVGFGNEPEKSIGLTLYADNWWSDHHTSDISVPLNQWSHVVFTANTIDGEVKVYINGKNVGSWERVKSFLPSDYPLYLGYQVDDESYYDGMIDDVRIYNRPLSEKEVIALFKKQ